MLEISKGQMAMFEAYAVASFEHRTYLHLLRYFPRHCQLIGEAQMKTVIRHGWQRAKHHHLIPECCVRSYIDLMCLLGSGFDSDILLPWARQVLRDRSISDPIARGDRLYERAWHYIDHIAHDLQDEGRSTTTRFAAELRQLEQLGDQEVTPAEVPVLLVSVASLLQRVLPAKCSFVGERRLKLALSFAARSARTYQIVTERGLATFLVMRFILGAEFDRDPLLPWVSAILDVSAACEPRDRANRLFFEAASFLHRWWDVASKGNE